MGENEQGGMLRVVVVVGLVAIIAAVVIFAVLKLKENMSGTTDKATSGISNKISQGASVSNTAPAPAKP